jgi:DeoR/GlpR family transcriptional regulator of sugar metabolism
MAGRSEEILQLINFEGKLSVEEIATRTFASPATIRRNLIKLEQQGLIHRHHGGAESVLSLRPPQIVRHQYNQKEKKIIAERASALVSADSCIFIDASTTLQYMIPHLSLIKNLTVYTNGADTAIRLAEARIRVICTGGELLSESMAYIGAQAIDTLRRVYFDAMFFSSAGFDSNIVSDWSESETVLRRTVMEQSDKKYFLADSTKQDKRFNYIVCRTNELDEIICE